MHPGPRNFLATAAASFPGMFAGRRVLEIGSLDINGGVRDLFLGCRYIGLDVAPGRGVDVVCQGQDYDAPDGSFDVVLSCEAMEHNPHWRETFANMARLCRPGGLVLMTCATFGRHEHGTRRSETGSSPLTCSLDWEYYRNLGRADLARALDLEASFSSWRTWSNWRSYDLYFAGVRRGATPGMQLAWQRFGRAVDAELAALNRGAQCRVRALAGMFGERPFGAARALKARLHRSRH